MSQDWSAFDRACASRRRAIVESFVEFLRLESVSQASKLPVPHDAASADAGVVRKALTANARTRKRRVIGATSF